MTYHDSLLNRVERLARQAGRTDEQVARLHQQEHDLRHARDAAVRELQELRPLRKQLESEIETLKLQVDMAEARIKTLQGAMAADEQRLRAAEERVWPGVTWGCDAPEILADEICLLRNQLANRQQELSEQALVHGVELQRETADLQQQLESARSEANVQAVRLVAAQRGKDQLQVENHSLAITLQRLRRFASAVQGAKQKYQSLDCEGAAKVIEAALNQLQATDAVAAATVAGVKLAWSGDQPVSPTVHAVNRNYEPTPLGQLQSAHSETIFASLPLPATNSVDDSTTTDGPAQS
jgi:DNA repair exonuclease SbcCD ATPase subunit